MKVLKNLASFYIFGYLLRSRIESGKIFKILRLKKKKIGDEKAQNVFFTTLKKNPACRAFKKSLQAASTTFFTKSPVISRNASIICN